MMALARDEHETSCPRCDALAEWSYLGPEKNRVEVMCPNCGRYDFPREEFDRIQTGIPK